MKYNKIIYNKTINFVDTIMEIKINKSKISLLITDNRILITLLTILFINASVVKSAAHYVSPDGSHTLPFDSWSTAATNIQDAVDIAVDSDIVIISNGTYFLSEQINVTNAIIISSLNGSAETIIDGGFPVFSNSCFNILADTEIYDLTVTRGYNKYNGSGIHSIGKLLVANCIISNNSGYGVYCENTTVITNSIVSDNYNGIYFHWKSGKNIVIDSEIARNKFENEYEYEGGGVGIYCSSDKSNVIKRCNIYENGIENYYSYYGGGIYGSENLQIEDCKIYNNKSYENGAGIYLYRSSTIKNCEIFGNKGYGGAGIHAEYNNSIINCKIYNNSAYGYGGGVIFLGQKNIIQQSLIFKNTAKKGGGIYFGEGLNNIENCTIVNNTSWENRGGGIYTYSDYQASTCINSIVYYNIGKNISFYEDTYYPSLPVECINSCTTPLPNGENNITNEPDFSNWQADDFHLSSGSPCINSGTNLSWMISETDLDENPRIENSIVDIGVYEFGALNCSFGADKTKGNIPLTVNFKSYVSGNDTNNLYYRWDFDNDGTFDNEGTGADAPQYIYSSAGTFSVKLIVSNTISETAEYLRTDYIKTFPVANTRYVSLDGGHVSPFLNWSAAATNIQNAVDVSGYGDTIIISNGTYYITNSIVITNHILVTSLSGAEKTIVVGGFPDFTNSCFYLDSANPTIEKFTITNGCAQELGGGVHCDYGGTVKNCVIIGNKSLGAGGLGGGGVACYNGGQVENCVITGNNAPNNDGGGVLCRRGGLIKNCIIKENSVEDWGGGIVIYNHGIVQNCMIVGNSTLGEGGGVYCNDGGEIFNCTITDNKASLVGGTYFMNRGTLINSIVYYNEDDYEKNYSFYYDYDITPDFIIKNCCLPGDASTNENCMADQPDICSANNPFLLENSPCINAGNNSFTGTLTDIDGEIRIYDGTVDIGCDEFIDSGITGGLSVAIIGNSIGMPNYQLDFFSDIKGKANTIIWEVSGGALPSVSATNSSIFSHIFTEPGSYNISLTAENNDYIVSTSIIVEIVSAFTNYVSLSGGHISPFTTKANAATNIQFAIDAAAAGGVVIISTGTYQQTKEISVSKPLEIYGESGAENTILIGKMYWWGFSYNDCRCFNLKSEGIILDGLTISRGRPVREYGGGGGVFSTHNVDIKNCIIYQNAGYYGGGVYLTSGGTITNCQFLLNSATYGGGIYCGQSGIVQNCSFSNNWAMNQGGGVYLNNSYIENCKINNNYAGNGYFSDCGGIYLYNSTMRNCLVNKNISEDDVSGVYARFSLIDNCTIVSNNSVRYGDGIYCYSSTVHNTIIYFNKRNNYGNNGSSFSYCCSTPLLDGVGNITNAPMFINFTNGNYRLLESSPCIEAGTNMEWMWTSTDLDGEDRIQGTYVDMGAYEQIPEMGAVFALLFSILLLILPQRYGINRECI